jgi:1-acylglycerone phosphate reductase
MASHKTSVLITGCTPGGIGHALALEFHSRGCQVIATARRVEVLEDLAAAGLVTLPLDVTSKDSIARCKTEVERITDGRLDILVNNAGRPHVIPALDFDLDDARQTYDTNVFGPMLMVQAFIGLLKEARGLVVMVSSASTELPYLFSGVYSASKNALNQYSRILRMELRPLHVRVMVSMTGTVRSNIAGKPERDLPAGSYYRPVDDLFQKRLLFSQENGTMGHDVFARKLVAQALRGEGWFGAPDWFWGGGMSSLVWFSTLLPRWMTEGLCALYFGIPTMSRRIAEAEKDKTL